MCISEEVISEEVISKFNEILDVDDIVQKGKNLAKIKYCILDEILSKLNFSKSKKQDILLWRRNGQKRLHDDRKKDVNYEPMRKYKKNSKKKDIDTDYHPHNNENIKLKKRANVKTIKVPRSNYQYLSPEQIHLIKKYEALLSYEHCENVVDMSSIVNLADVDFEFY